MIDLCTFAEIIGHSLSLTRLAGQTGRWACRVEHGRLQKQRRAIP